MQSPGLDESGKTKWNKTTSGPIPGSQSGWGDRYYQYKIWGGVNRDHSEICLLCYETVTHSIFPSRYH